MNQYEPIELTIQKCADPDCNNEVSRKPCEVRKGHHLYCSAACLHKYQRRPRKYHVADILWVIENNGILTRAEMAKKFNVTLATFNRAISSFRSMGYDIPKAYTNQNIPVKKSILTDTQRVWLLANYEQLSCAKMAEQANLPFNVVKNFIDHLLKTGKIARTIIKKRQNIKAMPKVTKPGVPDGRENHRNRKPPVNDIPSRNRPMDERFPTRKINTEKCIKIYFHDKNKTTMSARDEEHVERIRKTYAQFEVFGSHLVYP